MTFPERVDLNQHGDTTPQLTFKSKDCLVFSNQADVISSYISFVVAL